MDADCGESRETMRDSEPPLENSRIEATGEDDGAPTSAPPRPKRPIMPFSVEAQKNQQQNRQEKVSMRSGESSVSIAGNDCNNRVPEMNSTENKKISRKKPRRNQGTILSGLKNVLKQITSGSTLSGKFSKKLQEKKDDVEKIKRPEYNSEDDLSEVSGDESNKVRSTIVRFCPVPF